MGDFEKLEYIVKNPYRELFPEIKSRLDSLKKQIKEIENILPEELVEIESEPIDIDIAHAEVDRILAERKAYNDYFEKLLEKKHGIKF